METDKEYLDCFTQLPDGRTFGAALLDALGVPKTLNINRIVLDVSTEGLTKCTLYVNTITKPGTAEEIIKVIEKAAKSVCKPDIIFENQGPES